MGPTIPIGTYKVKLIKGKETYTTDIEIMADPDSPNSKEDRALRDETVWKLYDLQGQLTYISDAMKKARDEAEEKAKDFSEKKKVLNVLKALAGKLDVLNKSFVATSTTGISGEEKLREKVVNLYGSVVRYSGKPTTTQINRMRVLEKEIDNIWIKLRLIGRQRDGWNKSIPRVA